MQNTLRKNMKAAENTLSLRYSHVALIVTEYVQIPQTKAQTKIKIKGVKNNGKMDS